MVQGEPENVSTQFVECERKFIPVHYETSVATKFVPQTFIDIGPHSDLSNYIRPSGKCLITDLFGPVGVYIQPSINHLVVYEIID